MNHFFCTGLIYLTGHCKKRRDAAIYCPIGRQILTGYIWEDFGQQLHEFLKLGIQGLKRDERKRMGLIDSLGILIRITLSHYRIKKLYELAPHYDSKQAKSSMHSRAQHTF